MQESNTIAISDMAARVTSSCGKLDAADDIEQKALKSAVSAHKRLDLNEKLLVVGQAHANY